MQESEVYNRRVTSLSPGSNWPQFLLTDSRGRTAALPAGETLYGFFKTTCPTCELAWPFFERIGELSEGGRLTVVAVSQDEAAETAAWNQRLGLRIPTLFDLDPWRASEALNLENVPTFFRVSADGKLRKAVVGFQRQKMQEFAAEAAKLSGKAPAQLFRPGENVPAIKAG